MNDQDGTDNFQELLKDDIAELQLLLAIIRKVGITDSAGLWYGYNYAAGANIVYDDKYEGDKRKAYCLRTAVYMRLKLDVDSKLSWEFVKNHSDLHKRAISIWEKIIKYYGYEKQKWYGGWEGYETMRSLYRAELEMMLKSKEGRLFGIHDIFEF